jgi:CheY-like chemotaxis protein
MRILVADQNALLLAAIVATFGRHCEVVTATHRDACMELVEQQRFDVVVACEKLADYTGLELLSEFEALCPATLRIFAARPESLRRLGKRLDLFGLLGTLSYPIEARKLVVALKVARTRLPARPKPPKAAPVVVRHIVLETEWDTGERLALLEQELEKAPPPEVPVVPSRPYCGELAANDEGIEGQPTPPQPGASRAAAIAKLAGAASTPAAAAKKQNVAKGPRARMPTTPTAAQREAFQRALARRNAGRAEAPPIDFSNVRVPNTWVASGFGAPPLPSQSLKDLARMATTKRPLPGTARGPQKGQPKRGVFVVGSGIVAVLLVGVLTFELHRATPPVEHGRHAHAGAVQLFSPNSTLADTSAGPPQVFSAPAPQPNQAPVSEGAAGMPQPQSFDPDTAPPDPPPPPALEHPGPMEPPSMAHNGPPVGMQGAPDSANGWNSE